MPTNTDLPKSYWHETFAPLVPADALPEESETVVVGGGLLGCWTAYWLATAGVDVTLLEADAISWGATGRNGGFLMGGAAMGYATAIEQFGRDATREIWALAAEGQRLAGEVISEEQIDCDFRKPGTVGLALNEESLDTVHASRMLMSEDGLEGEVLDRHELQGLILTPIADEVIGGTFNERGALLHSARYLVGVAMAAQRRGARLVKARVSSLEPGDGVRVITDEGEVRAGNVIVALNAWTDELLPELAGLILPVRGQILSYAPGERLFSVGMGSDVTPTGEYWQQTPSGSIVIGGCRADAPNGDVGVREMRPTDDVTTRIESVLPRLFPEFGPREVERRWAGLMAFTSDHLPIADAAPGYDSVWVTGGFCGHGMPFGPIVGKHLAEAAVRGKRPAALEPLRIDRPTLSRMGM